MGFVEQMKWWHWTLISLIIGAMLAYVNSGAPDASVSHSSVSSIIFETEVMAPPWRDPNSHDVKAWMTDFVVHPLEEVNTATGTIERQLVSYTQYYAPTPEHPSGQTSTEYYWAAFPYEPTPRREPNRNELQYPGAAAYRSKNGDTLESLAAKFYGKSSPQGVGAILGANALLRDAHDAAGFAIIPNRYYWIPWDPAKEPTVIDFLLAADKLIKQQQGAGAIGITIHYHWWESAKFGKWIWMGGSVLIIGIIWPTLLHLMLRHGLGSMKADEYDLSRFKGGKDAATMPAPSAAVATESDMDRLRELEAAMAQSLKSSGPREDAVTEEKPEPVVAKLAGAPVEAPVLPAAEEGPKSYQGEFYPVVKTGGKSEEKK